ncbi:MAG: YCF48-related protein [Bacteroidota bacterium]
MKKNIQENNPKFVLQNCLFSIKADVKDIFNTFGKYRVNILILFFFLLAVSSSFSQWKRVTNIPPPYDDNYYLEVFFLPANPQYGWICGYNGRVIRTTDGGQTWAGVTIPMGNSPGQLESVTFANESIGYVSGEGRIFKTTDGGASFREVTDYRRVQYLWGNFFITPLIGLVIGGGCDDYQNFFRTSDGGNTWELFRSNLPNSGLTDVVMLEAEGLGYATSSGRIWRTLDGGRTWQPFAVSGGDDWQEDLWIKGNSFLVPYSVGCTGGSGNEGGMRMSTNKGRSWKEFVTHQPMFGSFLYDELRGWAVGWDRNVWYTSDGGDHWTLKNCGIEPGHSLDDIWFVNDTLGWLVGDGVYISHKYEPIFAEIEALGDTVLCEGDSVILTPKQTYINYYWSTGERTKTITVRAPGTYFLSVSNSMCDSALSQSITVKFMPKPELRIDVPKTSICEGDSITLTAEPYHPAYFWSTGDTAKSIVVKTQGNYQVSITDTNGCRNSASVFITVVPNPKPVITIQGSHKFCFGDTITLETDRNYSKYYWYETSKNQIIDSSSWQLIVTNSGTYTVLVENGAGCKGFAKEVEIVVIVDSNRLKILDISGTPSRLEFDSVHILEINCKKFRLTNVGPTDLIITDMYIYKNIPFSIPQTQFPFTILPGTFVEVEVCYAPSILGEQTDTIFISDQCSPQIIPLHGIGTPNIYNGSTKCSTDITMITTELTNYLLDISVPRPNPASSVVTVPFTVIFKGEGQSEAKLICSIYDALGNKILYNENNFNLSNRQKGSFIKDAFTFDTRDIQQGLYWLTVGDGVYFKSFPVAIIK